MARYLIGNVKGPKGDDGFSPVATVTQTANGATISITDSTGTTTANIANGESRSDYDLAVANGYTGTPAEWLESLKGVSPTASVAQSGDNAVITVTDASGTTSATISAGGSYRAGEGIDITDGVISVTDAIDIDLSDYATIDYVVNLVGEVEQEMASPYTAGDGIEIDENNEISVDTTTIATKDDLDDKQDVLSAGVGISISNNEVAVDTSTIAVKSELFSGNYNDLSNKPDLDGFADAAEVTQALAGKQNTLVVGPNISLVNNVISATDTTYTAGTGISIDNGVISATGGSGVTDPIEFESEPDTSQNYIKADFGTFEIGLARYNSNDDFVNGAVMANDSVTVSNIYYPQGGGETVTEVQLVPGAINFRVDDVGMNTQLSWGSDSDHLGFNGTDLALSSDLPQPDGTTITESNGVWSAVGSDDDVVVTVVDSDNLTASEKTAILEVWPPKRIYDSSKRIMFYYVGGKVPVYGGEDAYYCKPVSITSGTSSIITSVAFQHIYYLSINSSRQLKNNGFSTCVTEYIPEFNATNDHGKVLTVSRGNGTYPTLKWETPSAGTTYTAGTGIDITNDEISVDNTVALKSELFSGDYDDLTNKPVIPDISNLATTAALTAGLATKQNTLTAGTGIAIDANNVISASGGSITDPIEFESEPDPDTGSYVKTSMGTDNSFEVSYFDGTHENPETGAYMVSDSVGVSKTTFDDREQTETTTETYINPEGINFENDGNGYRIVLGRDGLDIQDSSAVTRKTIATLEDIPEGVPSYASTEIGKVLGVVNATVSLSAGGPLMAPAANPELAWVEPDAGGITEDDIKNELIIETDHSSGNPYNELFISCDNIHITNYNEDDNEVGNVGMSYISETSYSEEDGNDIVTQNSGELYPTTIAFAYTQTNKTQSETVAETVARITPNFDDNIIEVEFEDSVAGTIETKELAFVEDLPTDQSTPARYLYLTDSNDVVYQIGVDTSGNLTVSPVNNN